MDGYLFDIAKPERLAHKEETSPIIFDSKSYDSYVYSLGMFDPLGCNRLFDRVVNPQDEEILSKTEDEEDTKGCI